MSHESFLSLCKVSKDFNVNGSILKAVNQISFDITKGETLGLVGESGCGKSTLGRVVMGVYRPSAGEIYIKGKKLDIKNGKDRFRYAKIAQMIFQDPYASLNPRMTIGDSIG